MKDIYETFDITLILSRKKVYQPEAILLTDTPYLVSGRNKSGSNDPKDLSEDWSHRHQDYCRWSTTD